MAGHSHWAGIKHKKGLADKKRGALFGKLSRAIIVAAQHGGGDPDSNLTLRYAIDRARKASMPKDNIDRAIKKGCGDFGDTVFSEVLYEGYGASGVAVMCDVLTDNRNRTAGELRKTFEVNGGNLGATGCVAWMFQRKGLFLIPAENVDEDALFEVALEAGADDVKRSGAVFEVTSDPADFDRISEALEEHHIPTDLAEITRVASDTVELNSENSRKVLKLMDALEESEDVQSVTANFNIPDDVMAEVSAEA